MAADKFPFKPTNAKRSAPSLTQVPLGGGSDNQNSGGGAPPDTTNSPFLVLSV